MRITRPRRFAALVVAATAFLATACGGDDSGGAGPSPKGRITVGSEQFPESKIIASMYSQVLKKAGYEVSEKLGIGTRQVYIGALEKGEIDVVPEYIGTAAEFFNVKFNGPGATQRKPVSSGDVDKTYAALQELAKRAGFVVTPPSKAVDQNAFAVTKEFADKNSLVNVSDLAKLNGQLTLGAGGDCEEQPFCLPGLKHKYGLDIKLKALGRPDTDPIYGALKDGTVQVGLVLSSSGRVAQENLVVLKDDKGLQNADNITALFRQAVPQEARAAVDKVNQALTTEKLQELNSKARTEDPADLARQFLEDAGLV